MFNIKMLIVCFATAVLGNFQKHISCFQAKSYYLSLLRMNMKDTWNYILGRTIVPAQSLVP